VTLPDHREGSRDRKMNRARQLSAAIFIVALLVRLLPLGLYVTPDEPIWVLRSLQFLEALKAGDPGRMPQTGHPGVTTMALGALGAWLTTAVDPSGAAIHADWVLRVAVLAPENGAAFPHLAYFLPWARVVVAVTVSAGVVLAYRIGRRRLDERVARLLALLLALDPFLAGHGALLHTDALQAMFVLLALLLVLPVRSGGRGAPDSRGTWSAWIALAGAALALALAGLTKMLGLLAAPGVALALFVVTGGTWGQRVARVAVLTGLTVLLLLVLYPPAWSHPRAAVQALIAAVTYHEGIGLRPVFFAGRTTTDPGPWFYPVVLLFRLTPPVLLGLVWFRPGKGFGLKRSLRHRHESLIAPPSRAKIVLGCLCPVFSYLIAITIAGKKFDRYVLTVVPLLTVIAAHRWSHTRRWGGKALLALLLLPWSVVALVPLQYASPLLGGPWGAQHVIPLGWGEASGLAAHSIHRWDGLHAEGGSTLMARNVPGAASFFPGETWAWDEDRVGCTALLFDADADAREGYVKLDEVTAGGRRQMTVWARVIEAAPSLPRVAPGPLPGVPPEAVAPVSDTARLQAWVLGRFAEGAPFVRIHAPHCYPLTEAQLASVLETDPSLSCEPADPVHGFPAELCRFTGPDASGELPPYLARFGGAVDLVAAAWSATARGPEPLTVRLRWQAHVPLGELDVYLALRAADGERDIVWSEGGRQVLNDFGWPAPSWPQATILDGEAYVPLPLSLPPGDYELVLRLADRGGWLGLSRSDGTFAGTELPLGELQVTAARMPAASLDLPTVTEIAWPGLTVLGYRGPAGQIAAGDRPAFAVGLQRDDGIPPGTLAWRLLCEGEPPIEGELVWPLSHPADWPEGYRYVVRFAPRVPRTSPAGRCDLYLGPAGGEATASLFLGPVRIDQRPRIYEMPGVPALEMAVQAEDLTQLLGVDVAPLEMRPGETISVSLYWQVLGETTEDLTVFAQLIGADGQVWGQSDSRPAGGNAPTMTWIAGEIIVDRHALTVRDAAPAGPGSLYVGLYDAESGVRLALTESGTRLPEDRAFVTEVDVLP